MMKITTAPVTSTQNQYLVELLDEGGKFSFGIV